MTDRTTGRIRRRDSPCAHTTTRRHVLGVLAAAGVAGLAGCAAGVEDEPDVDVVWYESDPSVGDVQVQQEVTVRAMLANLASAGRVEVTAETRRAGSDESLDSHSLTVDLDENEQREISFEMTASPAADLLDVTAEGV